MADPTGPAPDDAIEARALTKRYGAARALDGVDFAVPSGSCFALVGPNGAGKTTAVHILATLIAPDAGAARVGGRDVVREAAAVRRLLGVVFQESCLDPGLSAREHLDLSARIYRVAGRGARVAALLEEFGLAAAADRPSQALSVGQRRRLEIARAVLHRPRVLFLDEPTVGLDVVARDAVWERLRAMRDLEGTTLLLTTHSMQEADVLSQRVGILEGGRLVACGVPAELKAALGGDRVWIRVDREAGARASLAAQPGVRRVERDERGLRVHVDAAPRRLAALVIAAEPFGIAEVEFQRPSLEHVYRHHTGHAYRVDHRVGGEDRVDAARLARGQRAGPVAAAGPGCGGVEPAEGGGGAGGGAGR